MGLVLARITIVFTTTTDENDVARKISRVILRHFRHGRRSRTATRQPRHGTWRAVYPKEFSANHNPEGASDDTPWAEIHATGAIIRADPEKVRAIHERIREAIEARPKPG